MTPKGKRLYKIATALVAVAVFIVAVVIMVRGAGLSPDLDFGAGAYYYADIPDFEKHLDIGGDPNPTSIPYIVYLLLFLAWGALMYALWKWIDRH